MEQQMSQSDEIKLHYQYNPQVVDSSLSVVPNNNNNSFIHDLKIASIVEKFKNNLRESGLKTRDSYSNSSNQKSSPNSPSNLKQLSPISAPIVQLNISRFSDEIKEGASQQMAKVDSSHQNVYQDTNIITKDIQREKKEIEELHQQIAQLNDSNKNYINANQVLVQRLVKSEQLNDSILQTIDKYEKSILVHDDRINELENQLQQKNEIIDNNKNLDLYKKILIDDEFSKLTTSFLTEKTKLHQEIQIFRFQLEEERIKIENQTLIKEELCQANQEVAFLKASLIDFKEKYKNLEQICVEAVKLVEQNKILKQEVEKRFEIVKVDLDNQKIKQILNKKDMDIDELQKSLIYLHNQLTQKVSEEEQNNQPDEFIEQVESLKNKVEEQEQQIYTLGQTIIILDQKNKQQSKEIEEIVSMNKLIQHENNILKLSASASQSSQNDNEYDQKHLQLSQSTKNQKRVNFTNSLYLAK